MAKPELRDHRKFLKLRRLLAEPTPHVLGYLECLWHRGYQTGVPVIGDEDDVEAAAEYPGKRGLFAAAAHAAGFLDLDQATGLYSIHDLFEHAPEYAKKRMRRKGTAPKEGAPDGEQCPPRGNQPTPNGSQQLPRGNQNSPPGDENAKNDAARHTYPRAKNQEPRAKSQEPTDPQTPAEVGRSETAELFDPLRHEAEQRRAFVERWNAAGLKRLDYLNPTLQRHLAGNLLDPWWAESYPAALDRAGTIPFLRDGLGRQNGRLDVIEFLRDLDCVRQILDGRFDPQPAKTRAPPSAETMIDRAERRAREMHAAREQAIRDGTPAKEPK